MRKLFILLLMAVTAITATAQTVGEAFYIYRNDGQFNAFFRDEVDSIAYSHYDADSVYYDENVTQLVYTPDSLYRIPLAAIDSIGFVQPETKYKEDAVPLTGQLFDYLVRADGLALTFDASLPSELMPKIGDKLVCTDVTEKLPCGFVGQVLTVLSGVNGIDVLCDSIGLEDAVTEFYGVYDIKVGGGGQASVRGPRKAMHETTYSYDLPFGRIKVPSIDLSSWVAERDFFDISYNNSIDIAFTPTIHLTVTRVVDDLRIRSHTHVLAVTNVDVETKLDISGEASHDWDMSFLPKQDFIIPPGIPFYFDIGLKASLSGEVAAGFGFNHHVHTVTDITYYDASLFPIVGQYIAPIVNRVDGSVDVTTMDMRFDYLGLRAEFKPSIYLRVGVSATNHKIAWVGGEFEGGVKINGELMFDFRRLQEAEPSTAVYDELEGLAKIDIKPYAGAHFVASCLDDNYTFELGKEFERPRWTWYQGRIIPGFSSTKATPLSETKAQLTANITNDCFIPYTVGFALYDEDNTLVDTKYNGEKYWTRNAYRSYQCEFTRLSKEKKYKAYPVIRFFDKYDMLCSPSVEFSTDFPVTLSDFKVTDKQHKEKGFTHEGRSYDYCFNVSVTATLDDDAENIAEWGYAYLDPNGREALIPLSEFGHTYTDTRWAYYHNEAKSTCTLYGYVKYKGSNEPVYGERHDYPLEYGETPCPDENHPHWIDLGLPSGTQWRCCNEGASTPEAYGGYYTFGQVSTAPTLDQIGELLNYCSSVWTQLNGVNGQKFTGPNGGTIFLPAAGYRWEGEFSNVGSGVYFWSSTPDGRDGAYDMGFGSGGWYWLNGIWFRDGELSVRPVR